MSELFVHEIFRSIQGESTHAGRVCVFVRLAGCNLDCVYCDTVEAARGKGKAMSVAEVARQVGGAGSGLVEVTGGEPLIQPDTGALLTALLDGGREVLVETNGTVDLAAFDRRAKYIVDIKTPGSGAGGSFLDSNYSRLRQTDELKFVITSREDFDWAEALVAERKLAERVTTLFSPARGMVAPKKLAAWLLRSGLDARLNLQLHTYIWGPDAKGV